MILCTFIVFVLFYCVVRSLCCTVYCVVRSECTIDELDQLKEQTMGEINDGVLHRRFDAGRSHHCLVYGFDFSSFMYVIANFYIYFSKGFEEDGGFEYLIYYLHALPLFEEYQHAWSFLFTADLNDPEETEFTSDLDTSTYYGYSSDSDEDLNELYIID